MSCTMSWHCTMWASTGLRSRPCLPHRETQESTWEMPKEVPVEDLFEIPDMPESDDDGVDDDGMDGGGTGGSGRGGRAVAGLPTQLPPPPSFHSPLLLRCVDRAWQRGALVGRLCHAPAHLRARGFRWHWHPPLLSSAGLAVSWLPRSRSWTPLDSGLPAPGARSYPWCSWHREAWPTSPSACCRFFVDVGESSRAVGLALLCFVVRTVRVTFFSRRVRIAQWRVFA